MTEADIIRQAYKRDGIKGDKAISRETGINYDRLHKRRLAPGWFATYHALSKSQPTIEDAIAVQMEINQRSNTEVMFFRTKRYGTGEPLMKVGDHYFLGLEGSL